MKITYHPVQKQMRFQRTSNGQWFDISDPRSGILEYKEDGIILQNLGKEFSEAIVGAMDGVERVYIDFRGPKADYEDLVQMIKSVKLDTEMEILPGELAELPSVRDLFDDIKIYS